MNKREALRGLHVVTDYIAVQEAPVPRDLVTAIELALQGGARVIQLRYKQGTTAKRIALGQKLKPLTEQHGALLLVNDDVDAALAIGADGVHVGQDDQPAIEVRNLIGSDKILGVSAYTVDDALKAEIEGADYVGVLVFESKTSKINAGKAVGLSGITEISRAVQIPVIGIGGIHAGIAQEVLDRGAFGFAVIGDVLRTADQRQAAARYPRPLSRRI